jgi:CTP synthase
MSKYILVTGGVCSSLGKGVASSSIGSLLECCGLSVAIMKCDPYINVDAGNMSPYQHGEVYVTSDGTETDLDLGNYSRFTNVSLTSANCITTGKIYEEVINNERAGRYNGRTVQVIPHITDEIQRQILMVGAQTQADVVIVEIGGTVGDIESIPFLEATRQLMRKMGKGNAISVHLTLVPIITGGELKTKPTQHSVKSMQELGIQPDILLCRTEKMLDEGLRKKIAKFCNVGMGAVFTSPDIDKTIYELPIVFHDQGIDAFILEKLKFPKHKADISSSKKYI